MVLSGIVIENLRRNIVNAAQFTALGVAPGSTKSGVLFGCDDGLADKQLVVVCLSFSRGIYPVDSTVCGGKFRIAYAHN